MGQIRAAIKARIYKALDRSYFTVHDFEVRFPDSEETLVEITFIPKRDFHYVIRRFNGGFQVISSPGELLSVEFKEVSLFDHCVDYIPRWCQRILADLRTDFPLYDDLEHLYSILEEQINEHINDQEEHFAPEERAAIWAKLDSLLEKFEELERQNVITAKDLENIKKEMDNMREDLNSFSRGVWYRTAGNRVLSIISRFAKTKHGRSLLSAPVKGLLPGNLDVDSPG